MASPPPNSSKSGQKKQPPPPAVSTEQIAQPASSSTSGDAPNPSQPLDTPPPMTSQPATELDKSKSTSNKTLAEEKEEGTRESDSEDSVQGNDKAIPVASSDSDEDTLAARLSKKRKGKSDDQVEEREERLRKRRETVIGIEDPAFWAQAQNPPPSRSVKPTVDPVPEQPKSI